MVTEIVKFCRKLVHSCSPEHHDDAGDVTWYMAMERAHMWLKLEGCTVGNFIEFLSIAANWKVIVWVQLEHYDWGCGYFIHDNSTRVEIVA